jgi:RES domain-containing protein
MPGTDQVLWRIAKHTAEYKATDLTGGGARSTGGRWNSKGKALVYSSTTVALATLETLAHLGDNIAIRNAFLVQINVPPSVWASREVVQASELPVTWLAEPPGSTSIKFGDEWLDSARTALLLVPSVIVPEEFNVLINPVHQDAVAISATVTRPFIYDPRL